MLGCVGVRHPCVPFVAVGVVGEGAGGVNKHGGTVAEGVGGQSGRRRWLGSPVRAKLSQAPLIASATVAAAGCPSRSGGEGC